MKDSKLESALVGIQKTRAILPDQVNAYLNFTQKVKSDGAISEKNKALILVSLAVYAQCEMCIESNVTNALSTNASKEEIVEAALTAVSMGGGPKMMYMQYVHDALEL